jgi:DNA-binding response OmpR family regulator
MHLTVVLAVGLDLSLLTRQSSDWQSAGYVVTSAGSVREAIAHFRDGDFDLVLLGNGIPPDSKERLTFLLRASGSRIPVVCITNSSSDGDSFAGATIRNEPINLLQCIEEIMANRACTPSACVAMRCILT